MLNFAANISWLFQEWDFYDRFAAASDAGFVAVECLFPYEHDPDEIARHLARHKLTMALINLPPGDLAIGERGLAALPGRGEDFRAALNKGLRYAGATGARRLHAMAGIADGPAAMEAYRDALALACDIAGPHGIDITIEPLNGQDVPGYLMNDFALARQVIAGLKRSNLKLQFDVYHRRILQGDVIGGLEELMPIIGHIQIASAPGRHEPTSGERVNGEVDDRDVLNAIDRLGYRGFVGCEYKPAGGTLAGLTWLREFAA
ncbi:MAG: TIM barrel protein [Alphaproteobacteria bacterium]|nr:TIM barrel protein [Alphaproteobacteria bacterium]